MHIDLDISTVSGHVNLGGIDQPIIGQRKVQHDIRMHEGEVNLLGGLINQQDSKQVTGIPGLSSIPILRRLFTGESLSRDRGELMIVIIPHVVRGPEVTAQNLRGIAVGNQTAIKLNYSPKPTDVVSGPAAAAALHPAGAPGPVPSALPPVGAPPVTAPAINPPAAAATNPAATALSPPATAPPAATVSNPPATAPPATALSPPATAPPAAGPPMTVPPVNAPGTPPAAPAAPETTPPAGNASVSFSPAQVETRVASPVSVALIIQGGADVVSAPMQIQFDPRILRLNDIIGGDFLSSDGQQIVFTKNIMNDSGSATVQLNRQPGAPGVNGGGVLITLNFQAIARGMTAVNIPGLMVRNSQGQPVATGNPQVSIRVQ
jgi:general secretion pathway protein D